MPLPNNPFPFLFSDYIKKLVISFKVNAVISYLMQRGLSEMMAGRSQGGGIMSALSNFIGW
jgi:hypothetical protein